MQELYRNIRMQRERLGLSQDELAGLVGYTSRTSIAKIEAGKIDLPQSKVEAFAHALHMTPAALLGWGPAEDHLVSEAGRRLPILGEIACGEPIFASEDHDAYILASEDIDADFCLRAKGESMIGARILDGDLVFIRSQSQVDNGEIAAVLIGDEATLKRVRYDKEAETLSLYPENPKYKTMHFSGEELEEIKILGKAIAFQSVIQ